MEMTHVFPKVAADGFYCSASHFFLISVGYKVDFYRIFIQQRPMPVSRLSCDHRAKRIKTPNPISIIVYN